MGWSQHSADLWRLSISSRFCMRCDLDIPRWMG